MSFSWEKDKLTFDPWGNHSKVRDKDGRFALAAYTPPAERQGAWTLKVNLHGDRVKARQIAEAHVSRLMREFRNLNAFQGLNQNARRVDLYDGDFLSGYIFLKTVFGVETVDVFAPVTTPRTRPQEQHPRLRICPVVKGYAPTAVPAYSNAGTFVFLDGYFSDNVLYLPDYPVVHSSQWETTDRSGIKSLSMVPGFAPSDQLVYWKPPGGTNPNNYPIETYFTTNGQILFTSGDFTSEKEWEDCPYGVGTTDVAAFVGAAWSDGAFCGAFSLTTRNPPSPVGWEFRTEFHYRSGRSWNATLEPAFTASNESGGGWQNVTHWDEAFIASGVLQGEKPFGGTGSAYRRGDSLYVTQGAQGWIHEGGESLFPPRGHKILLVSPSYDGVQWIGYEELRGFAVAEAEIDGEIHEVRPHYSYVDWCQVEEV